MDRIAFIIGEYFIYWNSIILVLGAVVAITLFLSFYLRNGENGRAAVLLVPMAVIVSLVLSRLIHWYCRADSYASMRAAMTDYSRGGFALMGVFFGCAAVAGLLSLLGIVKNLPETFDCMTLAGGAGIAVGRLACLFTSADRGDIIAGVTTLPLVYPAANAVTGEPEYRLATFMLQAMITGAIFLVLTVFYLRGKGKGTLRDGDTALLFLLCYGASQIVLDSTRYDSLFFRSNGFISIVQILGLLAVLLPIVMFSIRMFRVLRWRKWFLGLWIPMAALLGVGGYMEYHVQRHGDQALFAYSFMSLCLILVIGLTLVIRRFAVEKETKLLLVKNNNL